MPNSIQGNLSRDNSQIENREMLPAHITPNIVEKKGAQIDRINHLVKGGMLSERIEKIGSKERTVINHSQLDSGSNVDIKTYVTAKHIYQEDIPNTGFGRILLDFSNQHKQNFSHYDVEIFKNLSVILEKANLSCSKSDACQTFLKNQFEEKNERRRENVSLNEMLNRGANLLRDLGRQGFIRDENEHILDLANPADNEALEQIVEKFIVFFTNYYYQNLHLFQKNETKKIKNENKEQQVETPNIERHVEHHEKKEVSFPFVDEKISLIKLLYLEMIQNKLEEKKLEEIKEEKVKTAAQIKHSVVISENEKDQILEDIIKDLASKL